MDFWINSVWHIKVGILSICVHVYVPHGTTYTPRLRLYIESKYTGRGGGAGEALALIHYTWPFEHTIKISCCFPPLSPAVFVPLRPLLTSTPPQPGREKAMGSSLCFAALATSNELSINGLVSSKLILWLLRGARTGGTCKQEAETATAYLKCSLVLQPRFLSKLLSHSGSHRKKKSHLGLQHINKLLLYYEGRALISMPYQSHHINRTNYLASDWLAGHLFWQKERKLISRDESKVEPCF